jgi:hypothetical protein
MYDPVKIAVPPKGRTGLSILRSLSNRGYIPEEDCEMLCWVIEADRTRIEYERRRIEAGKRDGYSTIDDFEGGGLICHDGALAEVDGRIVNKRPKCMDYKGLPSRRRLCEDFDVFRNIMVYSNVHRPGLPVRMMLARYDTEINGVPVALVGTDHNHAPDHTKSGGTQIAFVGFDEIAASSASRENMRRIKRWPGFNDPSDEHEPVILGSAGLGDFCAHMVIASDAEQLKGIRFRGDRHRYYGFSDGVIADQKYTPIYTHFVRDGPQGGRIFRPSKKVETDVRDLRMPGIAIVNTGRMVGSMGLYVYGLPVHQSETLVIANRGCYESDPDVKRVADALAHQEYKSPRRMFDFAEWMNKLRSFIPAERWVKMPDIEDMFFDRFDADNWGCGEIISDTHLHTLSEMYRAAMGDGK